MTAPSKAAVKTCCGAYADAQSIRAAEVKIVAPIDGVRVGAGLHYSALDRHLCKAASIARATGTDFR